MSINDQTARARVAQTGPVAEGSGKRKKKPNGYYQDWNNCRAELQSAIDALGHFPTKAELEALGLGSLATSVVNYHGGMRKAALEMGHAPTKPVEDGHWKDWRNCEARLRKHMKALGHFPGDRELRELGDNGLLSALMDYHGGLTSARTRVSARPLTDEVLDEYLPQLMERYSTWAGEDDTFEAFIASLWYYCQFEDQLVEYLKRKPRVLRPPKSRPNGYWQVWDHVVRELRPIIRSLRHFPTQKELRDRDAQSLAFAIATYHGGMHAAREKMGIVDDEAERPKGYWKEWEHVEAILRELTESLGHFPSHSELDEAGHVSAGDAIRKYHGGMARARTRLSAPAVTQHGHWLSWKTCEAKLRELTRELGRFPGAKWLGSNGHGGLAQAISKHHGGYRKVRERMGHALNVKPDGYWKSWKNVKRELQIVIDELARFPTPQDLARLGQRSLSYAISHHHDGFVAARKRMGYGRMNDELLARYAVELMSFYRRTAREESTFEKFLDHVTATCGTEEELKSFLETT